METIGPTSPPISIWSRRAGTPPTPADGSTDVEADLIADLPIIDTSDRSLRRISAKAWRALVGANAPVRYVRFGGVLCRIERDDQGETIAQPLSNDRLRYALARVANWGRVTPDGAFEPDLPPMHLVRDLRAAPDPPLPVLDAIITAPTFAPDGSLHATPGYHPPSRTWYAPRDGFVVPPVPPDPTPDDVARARALITDDLLGDFPLVGEADRAHAVALLLLPFVRGLIDGPTPLHLIDKPSPGTGGSLMADMLAFPALGRPTPVLTEGQAEDEWRKRLTARLRNGAPVLLLDNVRRRLDSAALASAITSQVWEDRLLG